MPVIPQNGIVRAGGIVVVGLKNIEPCASTTGFLAWIGLEKLCSQMCTPCFEENKMVALFFRLYGDE